MLMGYKSVKKVQTHSLSLSISLSLLHAVYLSLSLRLCLRALERNAHHFRWCHRKSVDSSRKQMKLICEMVFGQQQICTREATRHHVLISVKLSKWCDILAYELQYVCSAPTRVSARKSKLKWNSAIEAFIMLCVMYLYCIVLISFYISCFVYSFFRFVCVRFDGWTSHFG